MLGVVNLEQNNIIKLFSVMAVLVPPTLMLDLRHELQAMPELEWAHGYPMALIMMLAAAILLSLFAGRSGCEALRFRRVNAHPDSPWLPGKLAATF